jgi:hypothetical protein
LFAVKGIYSSAAVACSIDKEMMMEVLKKMLKKVLGGCKCANPWKNAKMKFGKVNHEDVLSPGNDKIKNLSVASVAKINDPESGKR